MVRSGVGDLEVAITSGSQEVLNNLHMGFKLERLYDGCRYLAEAGFDSMEFFLSLRFKKFVREHKENPWDWLRLGTKEIKKTRLRYHGGLHSGFEFIPECIRRLVISTVAKYGIDLTRTSNAWNNFALLGHEAIELKKLLSSACQ